MVNKTTKELKKPTQVIYKRQEQINAPTNCGEGSVYVAKGSDG
ncbi:hypothetical protein [Desulforamulus ferrireducens]|nr:hypothetical protein [Desulforamulus ferrireducens]